MVRKVRVFHILGCVFMMLFLLLMPGKVYAADYSCDVIFPVKVEMTGENAPTDMEFKVVLENVDSNAPVPGQMTGTVKGSGDFFFGPMIYTVPGDYHYRVYQQKGSVPNVTYDAAVYKVTIRVVNDEEGSLKAEIWALKNGSEEKSDAVKFINAYRAPIVPKPTPQTGDGMNTKLLIGLMGASVLMMVAIIFACRRRKNGK